MTSASHSPHTIWLIVDTESRRRMLLSLLQRTGHSVTTFARPEEALAAEEEGLPTPDLIITGLHMPGLGGMRFCRLLRSPAYAPLNQTPLLALSTTYAGLDADYMARALGANAFCPLPVAGEELLALVDDLLAGRIPPQHARALLVDTDSQRLEQWQAVFASLGYECALAGAAAEARARCAERQPDVVVITEAVLGDDPTQGMADLRQHTADAALLVVQSATPQTRTTQWMALGASAVLREPVEALHLAQAAESAREEHFLRLASDLLLERSQVLEASEARFRRIVETANEGIWEMDAEGTTTFVNAQMEAMLGYSQEEMLGRPVMDLLPEDEHAGFLASIEARRRGESGAYERRYLAKDGREVWTLLSAAPKFTPDGTFDGCFAMLSDITERVRAEQDLEASEARFRRIVETANEGIWEMDAEGRVTYVNQRMAEMLGYDPSEVVGRPTEDFLYPEDLEEHHETFARRLRGIREVFVRRLRTKSGETLHARISARPVQDAEGACVGAFAMVSDISEQVRAQQALEQERSLLRTVIDNVPLSIYVKDLQGRKILANRVNQARLGVASEAELLGTTDAAFYPPEQAALRTEQDRRVMDTGEPLINHEELMYTPTGEQRWLLTSKVPLRNAQGEIVGLVGIGHEVTERKLAEQALRESERKFRTLVEQAGEAMFLHDLDGRIVDVNRAACEQTGYSREELLGMSVFDINRNQGKPEGVLAAWRALRVGDPPLTAQPEHTRKDGSTYPAEITLSRVAYGGESYILSLARDATERVRMERELRDNAAFLQTLMDAIPNPIFYKDTEGRFLGCNKAAEEYGGIPREELIGKTVYDTSPPDLAAVYARADAELLANPGQQKYEAMFGMPDGSRRNVIYHKATFTDSEGKVQGLVGVIQDITERVQMEQALARERLLLRTVIDNLPLAVYAKDREGRKILTNPVDLAWIGAASEEEVLGKTDAEVYADERGEQYMADDALVLSTGETILNDERLSHDAQGNPRWTWGSKAPLKDAHGRVIGIVGVAQDITERKRADQALRESEERYRRIVETANEGIWQVYADSRTVFVNRRMAAMLGYTPEEMMGRRTHEFIPEEEMEEHRVRIAPRRAGEADVYERRFLHKEGHIVWCLVSASPVLGPDGEYLGALGMLSDITDRKLAEEALREGEAELTAIYENAPIIMMIVDEERRVRKVNGFASTLVGRATGEMLGLRGGEALRCLHALDSPEGCGFGPACAGCTVRRTVLDTLETGRWHHLVEADLSLEIEGQPTPLTVLLSTARLDDGDHPRALVSILDITDRKLAENALRKSEARFRRIVETANEGIWEGDANEIITYVNPRAAQMLGYTPEEMIGQPSDVFIHPEEREAHQRMTRARSQGRSDVYERRFVAKDGRIVWLLVSATPMLDEDGTYLGSFAMVSDVTERVRAEQALHESEERHRAISALMSDYAYAFRVHPNGRLERDWIAGDFEGITGWTTAEVDARGGWPALIHPDDMPIARERQQRLMAGQEDTSEFRIVRPDGTFRWLRDHGLPVWDEDEQRVVRIYGGVTDITEHRQYQETLARERALLRTVIDNLPIAVYAKDLQGRKILTNRLDMQFVAAESEDEILGKTDFDVYSSELAERFAAEDRHVLESGEPLVVPEAIAQWADGHEDWVSFAKLPLKDAQGETIGLVGITQNISERKQIEIALRESEERARRQRAALARLAVDEAIAKGDTPAAMARLAETLATTIGVARASVWLLSSDETKLRCISLYEDGALRPCEDLALDTARFPSYFVALRAEGRVYAPQALTDERTRELADWYLAPQGIASLLDAGISVGGKLVGVVSMEHIGEPRQWLPDERAFASTAAAMAGQVLTNAQRRAAEEALARERTLLRTVIDNLPYSVYAKDLEGRKTLANRANLQVLGVSSEEEVLGKTDFAFYPPEAAARFEENDRRVLTTGQPMMNNEHESRRQDGTSRWVLTSKLPLRDASGEIIGLVGITHDITERKRAEQERLEMERQLQHTQKLESLGVLAGGIAHDFNNLLMAILGNLDLALLDLSPLSPARESILQAMQAGRRAADVARQMLAYSGKGRFIIQPVNLTELVEENAHMLRAAIAKDVTLNLQVRQNIPPVEADPGQLQQVVINLITNASEAIGDAPGVVRLSTGVQDCDEAYLAQSLLPNKPAPGRYVYLEVADTGGGMDAQTLTRIFDPFFTTKATGRGLGMAAVQGIVSGHGGAILIESEPGRGTTVRVLFRAADDQGPEAVSERERPGPEEEGAAPPRPTATILVVDDEEMVRRLAESMLERLGYRVLSATNGEEAIATYREHAAQIDGVLMDLTMPRMDGAAASQALLALDPSLPVILCSGYSEQENAERFAGLGLAGFIQKPYTMAALAAAIEKALHDDE